MARTALAQDEILSNLLMDDADDTATEPVVDDYLPAVGQSIPVPKSVGKMFETKILDKIKADEVEHKKWDMCFQLYRQCGNEGLDADIDYRYHAHSDADENIIRINIRTLMRSTYMQNPHLEFSDSSSDSKLGETLEEIISFLMGKQTYPGINMKPKVRRWIMHGQLTNFGVMRLDYQAHEGSRQEAVDNVKKLEELLKKAKNKSEVEEIYARLAILHDRLPLSQGKGMHLFNVLPQCLVVDPNCTQFDLSDADWVAEWFDMDRTYMEQMYYTKDEDGNFILRANPKITRSPRDEAPVDVKQIITDTVLNHQSDEQRDLIQKNTVRCYYVYDKILRRIYLFNSEDWSHPLWVVEDDMHLSRFFRHFILSFSEPIEGITQPGEVSFYVGQTNEINKINRKAKQIRDSVFNTIVYNSKNVDKNEVEKLVRHLENPGEVKAFGVATDPEKKIMENLEILAPPAVQFEKLFDTSNLRGAIDRAAATSEIDRGGQFKTNTTNDAVQYHAQQRQQTTSVLIDTIEDSFEALGWSIAELLVSKYSKEDITALVGAKLAEDFEPLSVEEFNHQYRMKIAAGSIEKPTTEFKKQESINVAQALGQVGQAAPGTTMKLMIRMFKNAFSGLVVTKEDWASLEAETQANLQKGISTNGQEPSTGPAPRNS